MKTMEEFVREHGIKISCKRTASNPHMTGSSNMDHWRCTLSRGRKRMTLTFSMGYGHGGRSPSAEDVLNAVALDSTGYANARGFEDWCSEYGLDSDNRSAHKTFKQVEKQYKSAEKLLGAEGLKELMYEVEGL